MLMERSGEHPGWSRPIRTAWHRFRSMKTASYFRPTTGSSRPRRRSGTAQHRSSQPVCRSPSSRQANGHGVRSARSTSVDDPRGLSGRGSPMTRGRLFRWGILVPCLPLLLESCGYITVYVQTVPPADPGRFNVQIDGTTRATDAGDAGVVSQVKLPTGNHVLAETAGTATDLGDFKVTI